MNKRLFIGSFAAALLLSACSFGRRKPRVSPRITFQKALLGLQNVQTVDDLKALLGPPHHELIANFADDSDPVWRGGQFTRKTWLFAQFDPPNLPETMTTPVALVGYSFFDSWGKGVGGGLTVYFDLSGKRLGWSYSRALPGLEAKLVDINDVR